MITMGLDPSFRHTGYAIFETVGKNKPDRLITHGIISIKKPKLPKFKGPKKNQPKIWPAVSDYTRCLGIANALDQLLTKYAIESVSIEAIAGSQSSTAAKAGGCIIGTIAAVFHKHPNIITDWCKVGVIKELFTLDRNADKTKMEKKAFNLYPDELSCYTSTLSENGFRGDFEHVADAIAIHFAGKYSGAKPCGQI